MSKPREPYPSDVTDDEWAFAAPYLALLPEGSGQRTHDLRLVFDALRYVVKSGCHWRMMPHEFPPWAAVYQQARRWLAAGCFEAMAHDLRELVRVASGRAPAPTACAIDGRTLRSTPESGGRAGYDGHKRTRGSRVAQRSILWACSSRCASRPRTRRSGPRWPTCARRCRRRRARP